MDGDCFRAGGSGHAASALLSHWRPGFWILARPALDAGGDTGGLLCPVSFCALGRPRFRPSSLAAGRTTEEAFSRPFGGTAGLCRAPAPHQRAGHQLSPWIVTHPTPPLSVGHGFRNSARSHPVHAGSQRHGQADRPGNTALYRRCSRGSPIGVRLPVVFLSSFKIAGRTAKRN